MSTENSITDRLAEAFKQESDALFDVINGVKQELKSRDWIFEGRGPYQWDDDRYREEAGLAFAAMKDIVEKAVRPARERYDAVLDEYQEAKDELVIGLSHD